MFRFWIGLFALAGFAFTTQAQSTIGVILASGPNGGEPTSAHFSWYNVPTDVRAIAVTSIVTMSASPLGTGLVNLATGIPIDPATVSAGNPLTFSLPNAAYGQGLGGGSIPAGFFGPSSPPPASGSPATMSAQVSKPASGAGSVGYSLYSPEGSFLGGATIPVPEDGWWVLGVDGTTEEEPGSIPIPVTVGPAIDTPEPATLLMGGMGLAAMAGWRLRRKR